MSEDEKKEVKEVTVVHGDKDKYGFGKAMTAVANIVSYLCQLAFIIVLALFCAGDGALSNTLIAIFGK
jgi:hypothetical protein